MIENSKIIQLFILDYTNFVYNVNSNLSFLYESRRMLYELQGAFIFFISWQYICLLSGKMK